MKNRYFIILIFLSFVLLITTSKTVAQNIQNEKYITIKLAVQNVNGLPIKGAKVYGNDGTIIATTDISGYFTISIPDLTDLFIESDGYESRLIKSGEYMNMKMIQLNASQFLFGSKDDVNIAFRKTKKGNLIGAISVINTEDLLKYDNNQLVSNALIGRIPGLIGSSSIRGIGSALFIVDGLPRDIFTLTVAEVEQITVLKDINSVILYGTAAENGVVLITTKRGQAHKNQININGYYGISSPMALPKYVSSSDYMQLNNEARVNDGLAPQYDALSISNYASGNKYRYPSVDYYSSEYLKSFKPFFKAITELSGGNDVANYYSNIGWEQQGSLLNFGEGKNAKQNRFNARGNVDLKINSFIKTSIDAVAVFNNNLGPVSNYWSSVSTLKPNLFSPLIPLNLISSNNALLNARKNDVNGMYLLGGTSSYLTNPIADVYSGGNNENVQRTLSFNNTIDFDLSQLIKGLSLHTSGSFDLYTRYDQAINNTYSVYTPVWDAVKDSITSLTKNGTDSHSGTQAVANSYYERRFGFYGTLDYDRTFKDVHHFSGSLLVLGNRFKVQNDFQGQKNANLGLRLTYDYNKKYFIDFSSALANSVKLPAGNRTGFSPSVGLGWVISSEKFMKSVKFVDYLKLRMSGGIINSDAGISGFYYYDNVYSSGSGYTWYEGTVSAAGTVSNYGGNPNLFFEKNKQFNLGFESYILKRKIGVDVNFFENLYSGLIQKPLTKYPSFDTDFIPYENFGKNSFSGAELGLTYNQSFGDLSVIVGANAMYQTSKVLKKDEVYANNYQYRTGHPVDAIFGLVADGFFMDQNDINSHALQAFGKVVPGDIKYVDQNKDGVVDANDEVQIGRWQPTFSYGLNLKIAYKNITLFVIGNGGIGSNAYINGDYYWVDGNDKYSTYILNRWTEATKTTATFPRLSSQANSNNFRNSTFWLYKDNFFSIQRVQLTYEMPENFAKKIKMQHLSLYVNGSNLLTISKYKAIKELSVGAEPYYRSFSFGVKTMF